MKRENIPGWPNYYISKSGRLFSNKSGEWKEKKYLLTANGRPQYRLYRTKNKIFNHKHHQWYQCNTESRWFKVSRLVAMVYIPNPNNYPIVMHLDDNPLNNNVSNLQWGTQKMNIQDAINKGRFHQCKRYGKDNPMYGKPGPMLGRKGKLHPAYGNKNMLGKQLSEETKTKISNSLKQLNRTKITHGMRKNIFLLRDAGLSQSNIASIVNLHQTAVSKVLNGKL